MASRCLERFVMAVSSKDDCHGAQRQASQLETSSLYSTMPLTIRSCAKTDGKLPGSDVFLAPLQGEGGGIV